jgi:hypothetical protein
MPVLLAYFARLLYLLACFSVPSSTCSSPLHFSLHRPCQGSGTEAMQENTVRQAWDRPQNPLTFMMPSIPSGDPSFRRAAERELSMGFMWGFQGRGRGCVPPWGCLPISCHLALKVPVPGRGNIPRVSTEGGGNGGRRGQRTFHAVYPYCRTGDRRNVANKLSQMKGMVPLSVKQKRDPRGKVTLPATRQ